MITIVLTAIALILLFTALETLLWWSTWRQKSPTIPTATPPWETALVFITGISDYTQESLDPEQIDLINKISQVYAIDRIIAEPFPWKHFSNKTSIIFKIWNILHLKPLPLWVMSLHNFWQTILILGFTNYYGKDIAHCLLNPIGLPKSNSSQLIFLSGSTGTGMALASLPHLKKYLPCKLMIISYGGVFGLSPGLNDVDQFFHLLGNQDHWAKLAEIILLNRGNISTAFTKAQQEKRLFIISTGEHKHLDYLSDRHSQNQLKTNLQLTLETILNLKIL
ncbi:MAG: hypothetical protein RSE13_22155 [Planktothrix sp. GU0601_MAG3]|nr:MAG: hypothetical protein RSE13_22155 [Planktothrix sp. GU0601_MAG3]